MKKHREKHRFEWALLAKMNQQNIDVVIKAQDSENKTICVLV
jgi:hypothetical protein